MSNDSREKPLLEWESFPLKEFPERTYWLLIYLAVALAILWFVTVVLWEAPFFYVLGFIFLVFPLLPYFISTKYKLYEKRIEVYYTFIKSEKKYSEFGCYYSDKKGVMLSTFRRPRWLDSYRGQSLRFSKNQKEKEKLYEILEDKIGNNVDNN